MFRKFSYLASVSVIASMAINPIAQAMDNAQVMDSDEKSIKCSQKREDSSIDSRHHISSSDILEAAFQHIECQKTPSMSLQEEARLELSENSGKWTKLCRMAGNAYFQGNYDEVAGEVIEFLIASLSGTDEALKFLLGKSSGEFKEYNTDVMLKASETLVNKFIMRLSQDPERYTISPNGIRQPIYFTESLFKTFAKRYILDIPIATPVLIWLLDNDDFKDYITRKLTNTVYGYFEGYLAQKNIVLKEVVGGNMSKFAKSMIYDESSFDIKEIWQYAGPRLTHYLREFIKGIIIETKNTKMKQYDGKVRAAATLGAYTCASTVSYVVGSMFGAWGSLTNDIVLRVMAYPFSTYIGSSAIGASYAYETNFGYYDPIKNRVSKWVDSSLDPWLHQHLMPYTFEEHLRFGLNENPSEIEINLLRKEYQLREKLLESYARKVSNCVYSLYNAVHEVFSGPKPLPPHFKYCMNEKEENAVRQLMILEVENPEEAQKIRGNLERYPSYEQKLKSWSLGNASSPNKQERAENYIKFRTKTINDILNVANVLVNELDTSVRDQLINEYLYKKFLLGAIFDEVTYGKEPKIFIKQFLGSMYGEDISQFHSSNNSLYQIFIDGIKESSIKEQDYIIKWMEKHQKDLKQYTKEFAKKTKYNEFFEINPIQIVTKPGEILLPRLNKEKIKGFFQEILSDYVSVLVTQENNDYFERNNLDNFKKLSLTEEIIEDNEIRHLHEKIVIYKAQHKTFNDYLVPDVTKIILSILDDLEVKDKAEGKYLTKFCQVFPECSKMVLDYLDEKKFNSLFSLNALFNTATLDAEERDYFVQHYHEILLFAEAYHKLKLDRCTFTLIDMLESHLKKTGVWENIKIAINKELSEQKDLPRSLKSVRDRVVNLINNDGDFLEYHNANESLRSLRGEYPGLATAYELAREKLIYRKIAGEILTPEQPSMLNTAINKINIFAKNTSNDFVLCQESARKKFEQDIKILEFHDSQSLGVRVGHVLDEIRKMKFDDETNLSLRDFIRTHKNFLTDQLTSAPKSVISFFEKYRRDIFMFKSTSYSYRNWLFKYKLTDLVQDLRLKNKAFKEEVDRFFESESK
ncbi:MAG: hypothetical protein H0X26_03445 [Alphaproteobacteria bacterium]|nr:hypothetical protein [Alphaproteobacteria bacterium]